MKKINKALLLFVGGLFALSSCNDWTEMEIKNPGDLTHTNKSEAYYAQLRAYKKDQFCQRSSRTSRQHRLCFALGKLEKSISGAARRSAFRSAKEGHKGTHLLLSVRYWRPDYPRNTRSRGS